jgi:hypothetical protein
MKYLNKNILGLFIFSLLLIFPQSEAYAQATIDNFNVTKSGNTFNFTLQIRQTDMNWDCATWTPYPSSGRFSWIVYARPRSPNGGNVADGQVALPINPNPILIRDSADINLGANESLTFTAYVGSYNGVLDYCEARPLEPGGNVAISASITCNAAGCTNSGSGSGGGGTSGQSTHFDYNFSIAGMLEGNNIIVLADRIVNWLIAIAIPIAVILIVYAGVLFITSRGNSSQVSQAKSILWSTALGFAILIVGKGFITVIRSLLNT